MSPPAPSLRSFGAGCHAAVIGASGGIGGAFARALDADPAVARVHAFARRGPVPAGAKIVAGRLDLDDEASIAAAAAALRDAPLRLVLVATGLLHDGPGFRPEKSRAALDPDRLARAFKVNAVGPAIVAKHFLPLLPREGRAVFAALSARVGSIADNEAGGWYGYRASKAALNMLLRNLAIETARTRCQTVILALQPGTVDTALSEPFQGNVPKGGLFAPDEAAAHLLGVIDRATPAQSGLMLDWRGERVAF